MTRYLIVDDNEHYAAAARDLLGRAGVTVVGIAATSAEALELAAALRPDAILVDVDLGEESGFDLVMLLTAETTAPVVLISAHSELEFADLIAASPAIGFLSKSELSAVAVAELIDSARDRNHGST